MKVQEIVNEQLYKALLIFKKPYEKGSIMHLPKEERHRLFDEYYDKIYQALIPFNPKLKPNFFFHNKTKRKIELWKEHWIRTKKGKNVILVRQDDWIEVYAKGGSMVKGDSIDPETIIKTKQELINTMEDW
jgi:hypothetical protein